MSDWKTIGKVRMTSKGVWDSNTAYENLDLVSNSDKSAFYISKSDVPAGTLLTNTTYWECILNATNGASTLIAPAYESLTFPVKTGQHCTYNDTLYIASQDINSTESWTASHWINVTIGGEVAELKSQTDAIEAATVVYTEPTNLLHGTITNGYIINADGSIDTRSEYSYSDYIEIDSSKGYIAFTRQATKNTRIMDGMTVAFYDASKSFISRLSGNVKTIPSDAAYIRQNIITTYLSNVYKPMVEYVNSTGSNIALTYSDWFEPYDASLANYGANFKNKKICVYGDSLAANGNGGENAWINILANILQFKEAYNRGIGASRITDTETRYAYVDADGDAYNRSSYTEQQTVPTGYTEINPCMSMTERINTIPIDTDVLIVLAGANDASGVTLDAIRTAYAAMLDGIYARVPNARVLLGTLLYNHNWDGNESEQIVEKYNGIRSIIKDMGALYGYPIIDFKGTMGINNLNYAEYMDSDGVHYTTKDKGKNRIAEVAIPRVFDIKYIN